MKKLKKNNCGVGHPNFKFITILLFYICVSGFHQINRINTQINRSAAVKENLICFEICQLMYEKILDQSLPNLIKFPDVYTLPKASHKAERNIGKLDIKRFIAGYWFMELWELSRQV